jgi:hypothetical protein
MIVHHMAEEVLLKIEGFPAVAALEVFGRRLGLLAPFGTAATAAAMIFAPPGRVQIVQETIQKVVIVLLVASFTLHLLLGLLGEVDLRLQFDGLQPRCRLLGGLCFGLPAAVLFILLLLLLLTMFPDMFV